NLAFAPDGKLWAATWPNRGHVIRFVGTSKVRPELMLTLDTPVDSLAFGMPGTKLEGLLFISNNRGKRANQPSDLILVDLATLRRLAVASGGTRGDVVKTTPDGRVLLSQSHQIDVLTPVQPPRVARTDPAPDAFVALPRGSVSVTFDRDMLVGAATDPHSV